MPLGHLSKGAYLPFGIECGACNNAYIYHLFDFMGK